MTATQANRNPFGSRAVLASPLGDAAYYRLAALVERGLISSLDQLPVTVRVFLENILRRCGDGVVDESHVASLAAWNAAQPGAGEFPFLPMRVILQDFTGVPCVLDLAAMRSAVARMGGDANRINPLAPADLVIDHSVQVDLFGSSYAFDANVEREYERNRERYQFLRWGQQAFDNLRVVPPGTGICHQVNLEYLSRVVDLRALEGTLTAFPDTLVGTDSHTTMVNGLGVLGWGVGGIEAEAVLLGQPLYQLMPEVIGFRLVGALPSGATATDLVLTVTQILRAHKVVGKFIEFTGSSLSQLGLADRATLSNMAPEYGATAALFPVDDETLRYLRMTGRDEAYIDLVERYCKEQGLFRTASTPEPEFRQVLELDLSTVRPSLAGPRRPQDKVVLPEVGAGFHAAYPAQFSNGHARSVEVRIGDTASVVAPGSVAIAAITSCTNTSNPAVMVGAGLVAQKAVARGLTTKPHVKTSLAPGSRAVVAYLREAGVMDALEALRFDLVGFGCTTCIGNSGPLDDEMERTIRDNDFVVAAVLSGNRNFEGRIHPLVKASYLASPPLVVAYALAGTVDIDLTTEPLGIDRDGQAVYLRDIWPTSEEIAATINRSLSPSMFRDSYSNVFEGDEHWRALDIPGGSAYTFDPASTYVQEPPFFQDVTSEPAPLQDIVDARVLVMLGDSVTTDHISPAGSIPKDSPAGQYLIDLGIAPRDFNSYGTRRGNHEVMIRGTFGNIRLRNEMVPGQEGDWTIYLPSAEKVRIFDAATRYAKTATPLVVIAGREYGTGSSRDWAAKGTMLLGVRAVLAESFERIHRSNLVGMGVLPLEFLPGESRQSHNLNGEETITIRGISTGLSPRQRITLDVARGDGTTTSIAAVVRIDTPVEVEYYRHGGVLHMVLRQLLARTSTTPA